MKQKPGRLYLLGTLLGSALVGAFTQRNRSLPSARSIYTPSRNSIWKWTLRFGALPNLWLDLS